MKLIIAGSRELQGDSETLAHLISLTVDICKVGEIVQGECPTGPDQWARDFFTYHQDADQINEMAEFLPDWETHGKAAGPIRNREMADYGDALLLIWDGESRGSASMKREMNKLNKPIYEVIIKETNT